MNNLLQLLLVLASGGLLFAMVGTHVRQDLKKAWEEILKFIRWVVK